MLSHFVRKLGAVVGWSAAGTVVEAGGYVWRLAPGADDLFGTDGPDLAAWDADGRVEVVKRNLQRTISRAATPSGAVVYIKLCRANTPRAWVREILRPPKARLEFENAAALAARGIATVDALAWASTPGLLPGASVLVTRAADAVPLDRVLCDTLPSLPPAAARAARRQLARGLGQFFARLHDAGVCHPDPHPGNLLADLPPSRVPRFVLMDVHAVRFGRPLTWTESRENLVLLNRWFQLRCSRADRARFWRAYVLSRDTLDGSGRLAREVETLTAASNARFWNHRTDRYVSNNREYRRVRAGTVRGYAVRDLPDAVLNRWLADPDAVFTEPGVKLLKDSRSSTVAVVRAGDRDVIFKRFRVRSWADVAKNGFRPSEALRSWVLGHNLRDRGLPTARPLAMLHRTRSGLPAEGYVAFEVVPDSCELPRAAVTITDAIARREIASRIGRLVRDLHDRQASHRDLKAPNVLLTGMSDPRSATPVLIDLVGVRAGRAIPRSTRVRDLARLAASFHGSAAVSRADRLRVLRAYLRWGLHGRAGWKDLWREIGTVVREKVAKNERSGRPLG